MVFESETAHAVSGSNRLQDKSSYAANAYTFIRYHFLSISCKLYGIYERGTVLSVGSIGNLRDNVLITPQESKGSTPRYVGTCSLTIQHT